MVLAGVFLAFTAVSPAAPVDLSAPGQDADRPQVAVNADGAAIVGWRRFDGSQYIAQAAARPAGGSWTVASDLSLSGQHAQGASVAIDSAGNATAVWSRSDSMGSYGVQAATRPAGAGWGATSDLSSRTATEARVAVDAAGNAVAVWVRYSLGQYYVESATRPAGGTWMAPVVLTTTGDYLSQVDLAVAPGGEATAVWARSVGVTGTIQAATRPAGGSWSAPVDLSAAGQSADTPIVAVGADGTAAATWQRTNGALYEIQAATRAPVGSWTAPADLSAAGQDAQIGDVAVDSDGRATATWARSDGAHYRVQSSTRPAGGPWTAPATLSAAGQHASNPALATEASGNVVAVWSRSNGTIGIVQAAARPLEGSWSAPRDLSSGQDARSAQVAIDGNGRATAVWERSDGANYLIQASEFAADLTPPAPPSGLTTAPASPADDNAPRVSGTAEAGSSVSLYANATCSGTPVATGTAAAFASPGFTVKVADNTTTTFHAIATDTVGNASDCSSSEATYVERTTSPQPDASVQPAPPTVLSITGASVAKRCVRSARLLGAPKEGTTGLVFRFTLSKDAMVRYVIRHRDHSQAWSFCPRAGGNVADTYTTVSNRSVSQSGGRRSTSVASAASSRRMSRVAQRRAGRRQVMLRRIVRGARLAPGSYSLLLSATDADGQKTDVTTVRFWVLTDR